VKLFIDSANLEEIKKVENLGILGGITTNPTLIVKQLFSTDENINPDQKNLLKQIIKITKVDILAEPVSPRFDDIVKEGIELAKLSSQIVIKIPMTQDGVMAVKELKNYGKKRNKKIKTAITLIFSSEQAIISALAGVDYICPFVGRLDDIGQNGMELIKDIVTIYKNYNFTTKVIVASVRNINHIITSAKYGADAITVPFKVIQEMFYHDLTTKGIEKFLEDWNKVSNIK
jgi:transaldolase